MIENDGGRDRGRIGDLIVANDVKKFIRRGAATTYAFCISPQMGNLGSPIRECRARLKPRVLNVGARGREIRTFNSNRSVGRGLHSHRPLDKSRRLNCPYAANLLTEILGSAAQDSSIRGAG
jgi:hypothetical protein